MIASSTTHAEPSSVILRPTYRVNFWEKHGDHAWNLDAFVIEGAANVLEALEWVESHRSGRRFELFVESGSEQTANERDPRTAGLVRLAGTNPNETGPELIATVDASASFVAHPALGHHEE